MQRPVRASAACALNADAVAAAAQAAGDEVVLPRRRAPVPGPDARCGPSPAPCRERPHRSQRLRERAVIRSSVRPWAMIVPRRRRRCWRGEGPAVSGWIATRGVIARRLGRAAGGRRHDPSLPPAEGKRRRHRPPPPGGMPAFATETPGDAPVAIMRCAVPSSPSALPRGPDLAAERGVGHDPPLPDLRKRCRRGSPSGRCFAGEKLQQVEGARFDRHALPVAPQLEARGIELERAEADRFLGGGESVRFGGRRMAASSVKLGAGRQRREGPTILHSATRPAHPRALVQVVDSATARRGDCMNDDIRSDTRDARPPASSRPGHRGFWP